YYLFKRLDGKVIGTRGHMARFRKQSETEPCGFLSPHARGKSPNNAVDETDIAICRKTLHTL
ncbi:MAG: hypothetical protein ACRC9V_09080, partial [Aeromonas sp.]